MGSSIHDWVISEANEMGYFPTRAQAKQISLVSVEEYTEHFGGKPPKERMREDILRQSTTRAIVRVMEGKNNPKTVIEGLSDAVLIDRVGAALRDASGKTLRVSIQEL